MPFIDYKETEIYYETWGEGMPLIYLHGWNGSMDSFKECILAKLKDRFQVVLIDFPGYGKSEFFSLSYNGLTGLVDKILRELGLEKVVIMGFCMGGSIALDYAIRYPEKISSIILLETTIDFPLIMRPLLIPGIGKYLLNFFLFNPLGIYLSKKYLLMKKFNYRKHFYDQFKKTRSTVALEYAQLLNNYSRLDNCNRIKTLDKETQVIIGQFAQKHAVRSAKRLQACLQNSELVKLENTAHFLIEENSPALANILIEKEATC